MDAPENQTLAVESHLLVGQDVLNNHNMGCEPVDYLLTLFLLGWLDYNLNDNYVHVLVLAMIDVFIHHKYTCLILIRNRLTFRAPTFGLLHLGDQQC